MCYNRVHLTNLLDLASKEGKKTSDGHQESLDGKENPILMDDAAVPLWWQ